MTEHWSIEINIGDVSLSIGDSWVSGSPSEELHLHKDEIINSINHVLSFMGCEEICCRELDDPEEFAPEFDCNREDDWIHDSDTVVDMNGNEILAGQMVMVRQDDGISYATVIKPMPDQPTVNQEGHWVDINKGGGIEGMPSYLLEVVLR